MQNITYFVDRAYHAYFKVKLGDQDKSWAPHKVCKSCVELLRSWSKGKEKHLPFGIPMIWIESKNHFDDCYFCMVNVMGCKKSNKHLLNFPNLESAIRPVPHCSNIPVPIFTEFLELYHDEDDAKSEVNEHDCGYDVDFQEISEERKKAGIFEGPQIRKLLWDNSFKDSMNEEEKRAWQALSNFLGDKKASNYKELVTELVDSYHAPDCNMSIKIHYLRNHLDRFPDTQGDMSEEQGERFHQDIKVME
ncbi:hypothetical protein LOD99_6245 [Oopsacas minuta]|uniref:Uncharacterized protein n=1 Tax=Oopsacas minuta TaxID=111878 RepID=A0AAV7JNQ6_9METZ|nr:hypothetical protein LOD99_6245 [Oopsacas minuta]